MKTRLFLTGLMAIALAGCATNHMAHHEREAEGDEKDEVKVAFAEVPANVQAVLSREAKGATIGKVDKETLNGKPVYEADVVVDGKNREIVVTADGTLVHNVIDTEDDAKPAAKKTAEKDDEEDEKDEMKAKK